MKPHSDGAPGRLGAVQTAGGVSVVGFRQCPVCGAALTGRQVVACSEKCRAIRWRERQAQARAAQDQRLEEVRGFLLDALRRLEP